MKTLLEILEASEAFLAKRGFPSPRVDAEWLLAGVLDFKRIDLYLQFERPMREDELDRLRPLLRRRGQGEPLQYILGTSEFFNCTLSVGPGVLVPRPETERLVELALELYPGEGPILDLCTGSAAILFALAGELSPTPALIGVEASAEALAWAEKNRQALELTESIELLQGDLFAPVERRDFAMITANPPYVSQAEFAELPIDVREHEPSEALVATDNGLAIIRRIISQGRDYLIDGGWLLLEIGEGQGPAVKTLLQEAAWQEIAIRRDYTKRDRIAIARK